MYNQKKSYLYAILSVLCWSTVATAFKIALKSTGYIQLLFYSSFISCIVLFSIILYKKKYRLILVMNKKDLFFSLLTGILNPFLYYLILFKAYSILPAQEAMTLNYTWPVMLVLLSVPFLKQKLGFKSILAVLISFSGIILIATKGNLLNFTFSNLFGDLLALSSSLIWASYWLINVKNQSDSIIKLFLNFFSGSLLSFLYLIFNSTIYINIYDVPPLIYIGIFEMSITFIFWLTALKYSISTDKTGQLIFISPFLSLCFIYFITGEKIHSATISGLLLIITGILIQHFLNFKQSK